ncbi:hypothetical protein AWB82_06440 [Caballeronia glebae]|jgi:hypothetical protein|uniref:Uncharacterized protein n=1 Tax=Caballeronia glebae TaxID=1777143 RepID=A0A158DBN5_9BURK|nr:hypothetical protein [Caballeronia glebae]SAK91207.1 hypothetical protein AWB82_06440 [Caballeronia glebae]
MTTLTITDLPCVEKIHRDAMSAIRGGILYVTNPDSKNTLPEMPPLPASWPGAAILTALHLPPPLPVSTIHPGLDPRLQ